jgi:TPR repeat protein
MLNRWFAFIVFAVLSFGAINAGDAPAKPEPTPEQRAQTFHQFADKGDANAQLFYGICVEDGAGVKKDRVEAAMWYLLSAQQGNAAGKKRFEDLSAKMSRDEIDQSKKLAAGWKPAKK